MKTLRVRMLGLLAVASLALAQSPATGGWRRVSDPQRDEPQRNEQQRYEAQREPQRNEPADSPARIQPPVPAQLTIRAGTFLTVRVDEPLSSDRNQPGDAFTATLARPIVVDGVVVAQRGQTVGGRVTEARRAGRVEGVSRLAIQLTDLTLVDGQQGPLQADLISRGAPSSAGRDAAAVGTTTALGAMIGASADWGRGAAIGAGAGAAAGLIGVLLTRGHATEIYPETLLTFRIEAPITISTERAPAAFNYVDPSDYERPQELQVRRRTPPPTLYRGYGYFGPGFYPYYPYGSFSFFSGPGYFYGRGYYRGRGGRRR